jgi:hypothetical protein
MKVTWERFATATARANPLSRIESAPTFIVRGVDESDMSVRQARILTPDVMLDIRMYKRTC